MPGNEASYSCESINGVILNQLRKSVYRSFVLVRISNTHLGTDMKFMQGRKAWSCQQITDGCDTQLPTCQHTSKLGSPTSLGLHGVQQWLFLTVQQK